MEENNQQKAQIIQNIFYKPNQAMFIQTSGLDMLQLPTNTPNRSEVQA